MASWCLMVCTEASLPMCLVTLWLCPLTGLSTGTLCASLPEVADMGHKLPARPVVAGCSLLASSCRRGAVCSTLRRQQGSAVPAGQGYAADRGPQAQYGAGEAAHPGCGGQG